jgi:DNA-binding protein H-NS
MKTAKLVTLILSSFLFVQLQAQNTNGNVETKEEKKVIIIKKTIDENGKEVTEKIIKEGDDADNIFFIDDNGKKIEIDIETITEDDGKTMKWTNKDGQDIKVIKKSQTIEIDEEGKHKSIRIKMSGDGEADIFEWDGEGELPESIQKELAAEGIDLNNTDKEIRVIKMDKRTKTINVDNEGEEKSIQIMMSGDDDAEVFEWSGEGEIPENIKQQLKEKGIDLEQTDGQIKVMQKSKKMSTPNQAFLGVEMAITEEIKNENGVETSTKDDSSKIVGIVASSAAEEAGLQKGDVITAIDNTTITKQKDVIDALGKYKKGDKITITYTRDGKSKKAKATLKGHSENESVAKNDFENKNVEVSVEEDAEGNVITTTTTTITKNGEKKVTKEVKKTKKD